MLPLLHLHFTQIKSTRINLLRFNYYFIAYRQEAVPPLSKHWDFWYSDLMDIVTCLLRFPSLNTCCTLYFGCANYQQQLFILDMYHNTFSIEQTENKLFDLTCIQTSKLSLPKTVPPITPIQINHLLTKPVLELTSINLTHF